jgi:hypothetical protein
MKIQEGTMIKTNNITGVVTQTRHVEIDEKEVTFANIIFQTENKPQAVYAFYVESYSGKPQVMKIGKNDAPQAANLEVVE